MLSNIQQHANDFLTIHHLQDLVGLVIACLDTATLVLIPGLLVAVPVCLAPEKMKKFD